MSAVRRQLYPNGAAATSAIFTLFPVRRSESLLFILPTKGEVPGVIVSGCCLSLIMTAPFVRDSAGCHCILKCYLGFFGCNYARIVGTTELGTSHKTDGHDPEQRNSSSHVWL